jgi:hypothetical protein
MTRVAAALPDTRRVGTGHVRGVLSVVTVGELLASAVIAGEHRYGTLGDGAGGSLARGPGYSSRQRLLQGDAVARLGFSPGRVRLDAARLAVRPGASGSAPRPWPVWPPGCHSLMVATHCDVRNARCGRRPVVPERLGDASSCRLGPSPAVGGLRPCARGVPNCGDARVLVERLAKRRTKGAKSARR